MRRKTLEALVLAGGMLVVSGGLTVAARFGLIESDTAMRGSMISIGLMMAFSSNLARKTAPTGPRTQRVNRVAGWSLTLAGLIYAVVWAFAPEDVALVTSTAAVALGLVITPVYCFWLRAKARTA